MFRHWDERTLYETPLEKALQPVPYTWTANNIRPTGLAGHALDISRASDHDFSLEGISANGWESSGAPWEGRKSALNMKCLADYSYSALSVLCRLSRLTRVSPVDMVCGDSSVF